MSHVNNTLRGRGQRLAANDCDTDDSQAFDRSGENQALKGRDAWR